MNIESQSLVPNLLQKMFISKNTSQPFAIITEHCLEVLLYILILNGEERISQLVVLDLQTGVELVLFLLILIATRLVVGVVLIKIFYPVLLYITLHQVTEETAGVAIVIIFLTTVLLVADVLSNIRMDFSSFSITGETLNCLKFVHPLIFILGILQTKLWPGRYAYLGLGIAFGMLTLVKATSMMRNNNFKQILLRLYLLLTIEHLVLFLDSYVILPVVIKVAMPVIVSQFLFQVYRLRKDEIKIDELYSQEDYFKLSFKICEYLTSKLYFRKLEHSISQFIGDEYKPCLRDEPKRRLIFDKLLGLLSRTKSFESELLKSNIFIMNNFQLLRAKHTIERLKEKMGYNIINKILIFRVEEMLLDSCKRKNRLVKFLHYNNYYKCDHFRSLLLKSATHHVHFWQHSRKQDIVPQRLRAMGDRMIDFEDQVVKQYADIEPKCTTVSLMFASYLFEVGRNRKDAKKMLEGLAFNEEFEVNFKISQKVFIRFDLEEEPLKILRVGHNVSMLLGYERNELEGHRSEMLLPEFFRELHLSLVAKKLADELSTFSLYKRETIIKNKWNSYNEVGIVVRLHYDLNSNLRLEGFLHLKDVSRPRWKSFMFVNRNLEIVECSDNLSEFTPLPSGMRKMGEVPGCGGEANADGSIGGYQPLIVFKMGEEEITCFVKKAELKVEPIVLSGKVNAGYLGALAHPIPDSPEKQKYNQNMREVLCQIFSKEYIILLLLASVFLITVGCAELSYYDMSNQESTDQNQVLNRTSDILYLTNNATDLMMDINYFDLGKQANYSNNFTTTNFIGASLDLHFLNERLRDLSLSKYSVPSMITGVNYSETSFEVIMEFLANAYIIKKFSTDTFIEGLTLERERTIMSVMNSQAVREYQKQYIKSISGENDHFKQLNTIILVGFGFLLLLIYLIILRCEYKTRLNQQQALSLICGSRAQNDMIESATEFIAKVTKEKIKPMNSESLMESRLKVRKEETSFAPDVTANVTERDFNAKSEVSMRELSGRNLMEDSFNKAALHPKSKKKIKEAAREPELIKLSPRKKKWFIAPLVIFGLIIMIFTANLVKNEMLQSLDSQTSSSNLFDIYEQSSQFSKSVADFFNYVNLKVAGSQPNSTLFISYPDVLLASQRDIPFNEISFSQFVQFQNQLVRLQYNYLCTYANCQSRFSSEINIIYSASIQKIMKLMNTMIASFDSLTTAQLTTQLATTGTVFNFDLVFYTQMLIRSNLNQLLNTYNQNYRIYSQNIVGSKRMLIGMGNAITFVGLVLFVVLVVHIYWSQQYLSRMVDIFKVRDELAESDQEIDEQKDNHDKSAIVKSNMA